MSIPTQVLWLIGYVVSFYGCIVNMNRNISTYGKDGSNYLIFAYSYVSLFFLLLIINKFLKQYSSFQMFPWLIKLLGFFAAFFSLFISVKTY